MNDYLLGCDIIGGETTYPSPAEVAKMQERVRQANAQNTNRMSPVLLGVLAVGFIGVLTAYTVISGRFWRSFWRRS